MSKPSAYADLREMVFKLASGKAGNIEPTPSGLYAVMLETTYPEATFSLVVVSEGTVSLYFSNGGGVIGAGNYPTVREPADILLNGAPSFQEQMKPIERPNIPEVGNAAIHLVTDKGIFSVESCESDLGENKLPVSSLFHQAHEVISAVREVEELRNPNQ